MSAAHKHGPAEGRGIDCPESLIGVCELERIKAEAWDEGWDERDNDCSEPYSPHKVNPYRAALGDRTDGEAGRG